MNGFVGWLRDFVELHERARAGKLLQRDQPAYEAGCRRLARALVELQRASTPPGRPVREKVRASRALFVDLELPGGTQRTTTRTLSKGGFSAFLGRAPERDREIAVTLHLPRGDVVRGAARVVDVRPRGIEQLASFAFVGLPEPVAAELEIVAIDSVLTQLTRGPWPVF